MKRIHPTEHQDQAQFFQIVRLDYRNEDTFIPELLFSVPNGMFAGGGTRGGRASNIAKMKAEGFSTGVCDIIYLQPRGQLSCLCIEMKREHYRNRPSEIRPGQVEFIEAVKAAGGMAVICYGLEDALGVFRGYMALDPLAWRRPVRTIVDDHTSA